MIWNWFCKKSKVSESSVDICKDYNWEPFNRVFVAGYFKPTSFNSLIGYINILTFQYQVYKPAIMFDKVRKISERIFSEDIELETNEDENTDHSISPTKINKYGVLGERDLNERSPMKTTNLKDPNFTTGSSINDSNLLEEIQQYKREFKQKFQSQEEKFNSITTKFQLLEETLTKSNANYKKKSSFMKTSFEWQVKSLKEKYDGLLDDQMTKTQEMEKKHKNTLKDKTQEIEKLTSSMEGNKNTMNKLAKITLFETSLGEVITDYLNKSSNNESFEDLFKARYPNFSSFSNETIIQCIESKHQEFLETIESLNVQSQGNDSQSQPQENTLKEMSTFIEEFENGYGKDIMDCIEQISNDISEVKQMQTFQNNEQDISRQLKEEFQKNKELSINVNKLQNNLVSAEKRLRIEIDTNNKLIENAKLHDITLNNLQNKYKMLEGNTHKRLTWKQMSEINADSKREAIGFDRIETLSHITLQNLVKQFCVVLAIPVDHMVTQLYQIGIVLKYERNILEYFINRLMTQWKGRKFLFETYREAAFEQYKQQKSLNNIEHPLFKEMNDLVDALLYKL